MVESRQAKRGRKSGPKRTIEGRAWTRRRVEIAIYLDGDLLDRCNEAFLRSDHRFFSHWAEEKLKEALK